MIFSFAKRIDVSLLWLMDPESTISRTVPPNFNAGRDDFTDDEILLVRSFRAIGGATKITAMALSPLLNVPPVDHGGETDQPKMTNVESPARSRRKSI